ncbi:MAG TPA: glycine cleavage T C-terminal barrel domain-containing protein [Phycisphaerales bacterium]|nr:glycine cleavage T C-terminal barrel domain-containing protein [Phycisphaerales bacterium]
MASPSPLLDLHRRADATLFAYGPQSQSADASPTEAAASAPPPIDLVATYGSLELEYAALRKHCALLDMPSRGLVEVTGPERIEFLNRMVTQELRPGKRDLPPYTLARSFWLSRKGRIDADLRICVLPDRVLLVVDALAAPRTASTLSSFIIMEDCAVRDTSPESHCIALHGPTSRVLLAEAFTPNPDAPHMNDLPAMGGVSAGLIATHPVTIVRDDEAGVPGFSIFAQASHALAVSQALVALGHDAHHDVPRDGLPLPVLGESGRRAGQIMLTPIGWLAFNIARIEAGSPLFNIDFGTENLPAETSLLDSRVSFTKGCYLGQEVVARMHARKQSKQHLVALRFETTHAAPAAGDQASPEGHNPYALLPEQGAPLLAGPNADAPAVGRITSSTLSPMLGMAPIAFAQVRSTHSAPGTVLTATVDNVPLKGVVQAELRFQSVAAPVAVTRP